MHSAFRITAKFLAVNFTYLNYLIGKFQKRKIIVLKVFIFTSYICTLIKHCTIKYLLQIIAEK